MLWMNEALHSNQSHHEVVRVDGRCTKCTTVTLETRARIHSPTQRLGQQMCFGEGYGKIIDLVNCILTCYG